MIDPAHPYISWYLWILGSVFAVFFVVPLLVMPLRFAKTLRWQLPADDALAIYLGRSLGAAGAALVFAILRAAPAPAAHPVVFEMSIVAGALLTLVHVVGAIEGKQPKTETAEIPLFAAVTLVAILMYRSL